MDAGMKVETTIQVKRKKSPRVGNTGDNDDHVAFLFQTVPSPSHNLLTLMPCIVGLVHPYQSKP